MTKYKDKILKNHTEQIKKEISKLKYKGFVLTENKTIYQYNIFNNGFNMIDIKQFYNIVCSGIGFNYWSIPPETSQDIINNCLFDILPIVKKEQLKNYVKYCQAKEYLNNELNSIGKRQLNQLLKENEQRKQQVILNLNDINTQTQLLINNDIFKDKNGNLWQYDKETILFNRLLNNDIENLLYDNLTEQDKETSKLIKITLNNMVIENLQYNNYDLVYCGNTPILWNEQTEQKNYLNLFKNDYKLIKSILSDFE